MRGRTAALIAASAVATGVMASTAILRVPPPPKSANGHPVQLVASGLSTPTSFAFGGGNVFEGDGGARIEHGPERRRVLLKNGTATKLAGSPPFVAGLAWHKGALYVSGGGSPRNGPTWQLLEVERLERQDQSSPTRSALHRAQEVRGLQRPRLRGGRPAVRRRRPGLTNGNDHGPSTLSPYLYDILSFNPNGKGLKVFATGMRQPWQFAFPPGRRLRSSLTSARTRAPRTRPTSSSGSSTARHGFPPCNRTEASKCKGFAKPFSSSGPTPNDGPGHHRQAVHDLVQGLGAKGHGVRCSRCR